MLDLAVATCRRLPEPDPDAAPLGEALRRQGIRFAEAAWDAPDGSWPEARATLIRSTWNYPQHPEAFVAWAARTAGRQLLWNPLPVVRWNLHKGYLLALERAGVPVTPTVLLRRGDGRSLASILAERGWPEAVVKPAVSAASFRTRRFAAPDAEAGQAHLDALLSERDVLVQRYLPSVEDHGERALVWVDGETTHAVRKTPRFEGEDEQVSPHAVPVSSAEAELARRALSVVDGDLLYARVDVAPGPDGAPVVMELELIEPSLFFRQGPEALDRLASALRRLLG